MKKFLALLLAAMMLLSCTSALAEDSVDNIKNTDETRTNWWNENDNEGADIDAFDTVQYQDGEASSTDNNNYDLSAELGTELWMQVAAEGQIDVTVPLVLVFQTNIDGGIANTGEEYKIMNNNNAEVVVTKMEFTKTDSDTQPMTIQKAGTDLAENQYTVTLTPDLDYTQNIYRVNSTDYDTDYLEDATVTVVGWDEDDDPTNPSTYDMFYTSYEKAAKQGGLFKLNKLSTGTTAAAAAAKETYLDVNMKTGRLTFVTYNEDAEDEEKAMTTGKGIHLLTATYTVAIDSSNLYGYEILGIDGDGLTAAEDATYTARGDDDNSSLTVKNNLDYSDDAIDDDDRNISGAYDDTYPKN